MTETATPDLTTLTVDLLAAYFATNNVPSEELAKVIQSTHAALLETMSPAPVAVEEPKAVGAVSIKKSLASPDHLLSLIDGKPYKTLRRHIASHGLTEAEYRTRYKLPANYPMVAPAYSEARRATAALIGLGRRKAETIVSAPIPEPVKEPVEEPSILADTAPITSAGKISPVAKPVKSKTPTAKTPQKRGRKAAVSEQASAPAETAKPVAKPRKTKNNASVPAADADLGAKSQSDPAAPVAKPRAKLKISTPET